MIQSNVHECWVGEYSSSLKRDQRYKPTDCFETFPFPAPLAGLDAIGERYYRHRQSIMQTRQEGLTRTYNRFHDPLDTAEDIAALRALHCELDQAVAAAYGWTDIDLGHGFHHTKQGLRYTLSEPAGREVLDRLLKLNFARYDEDVAAGRHDKREKACGASSTKQAKGAGSRNKRYAPAGQGALFSRTMPP